MTSYLAVSTEAASNPSFVRFGVKVCGGYEEWWKGMIKHKLKLNYRCKKGNLSADSCFCHVAITLNCTASAANLTLTPTPIPLFLALSGPPVSDSKQAGEEKKGNQKSCYSTRMSTQLTQVSCTQSLHFSIFLLSCNVSCSHLIMI